ncbi:UNVERIFIED_CONTAM: hypothetical protein Sradi_4515100 [Sesamum radiatum]|uniref:Uncharacterized protein n=1 Tax=Sesamum radiatum TaxID=300843 RepID=A0AAW2NAC1_SESRA
MEVRHRNTTWGRAPRTLVGAQNSIKVTSTIQGEAPTETVRRASQSAHRSIISHLAYTNEMILATYLTLTGSAKAAHDQPKPDTSHPVPRRTKSDSHNSIPHPENPAALP